MSRKQEVLLVADESSLMSIYNTALSFNELGSINIFNSFETIIAMQKHSIRSIFGRKKTLSNMSRKHVLETIKKYLGLGIDLNYIDLNQASSIPLGMGQIARNKCFYVSHPVRNNTYIPLHDYDQLLAKEKNNIFMELAASLGAKTIYLEDASFYNIKGSLETDFNVIKPVVMDIGVNARFEKDGSITKEVYSTFDKPKKRPRVPVHLQKWVDIDSDLSLMAAHRLENGLQSHKIILHFKDSLESTAQAAAVITGLNKSTGFKSSTGQYISSTWVFKVEYHLIDDK